jgi:hypothetical protein
MFLACKVEQQKQEKKRRSRNRSVLTANTEIFSIDDWMGTTKVTAAVYSQLRPSA